MDHSDEVFRHQATEQSWANRESAPSSDAEYDSWFDRLIRLPSCTHAGPIVKWARWMSIQQCWEYYQKEIMLLKIILLEMANQAGDTVIKESTRDLDSETAGQIAKKTGLISRVPAYIDRHLVRMVTIFCECTASLRADHQHRASIAQDIDESHIHHIKWACGDAGLGD